MKLYLRLQSWFRRPVPPNLIWPSIFVLQAVNVIALYLILPGIVSQRQSAFQPDSIMSFCLAGQFVPDVSVYSEKVVRVMQYFALDYSNLNIESCSKSIIETYKTRLFLPLLITASSLIGPWWLLLLPSILIFVGIGRVYSLILESRGHISLGFFMIGLLPFMSPHVTLHLMAILSEGPAMLMILSLILVFRRIKALNAKVVILVSLLSIFAVASRQIWPIVSLLCFLISYSAIRRGGKRRFLLLLVFPLIPILLHAFISSLSDRYIDFERDDSLTNLAFFGDLPGAFEGVFKSTVANLTHAISFFDLPLLALILISASRFLRAEWEDRCLLAVSLAWGVFTTGSVFVVYEVYGDNWRFLVFFFVLIPLMGTSSRVSTESPLDLPREGVA